MTRFATGLLVFTLGSSLAQAGSREQAVQIHNRVAGVPPSEAVLLQMAAQIDADQVAEAVKIAMNNESFYSVTLKNMATPWTNRDQTVFAPLNDYTATIIGLVRDDADFRTALYDDVIYTSNASGLPAYSNGNNSHYEMAESQGVSLKDTLVRRAQSTLNGLPVAATSGVITSRAAAKAFFIAGTNRAMFRFTLVNHLCRDLEQVHDTSLVPDFIRQDVSRSPGGDSRVFLNNCLGCHNGMDPMAKAYAYYDYEFDINGDPDGISGAIHYNTEGVIDPDTNSRVEKKYLINSSTFKPGYVTTNDDWQNYWRKGQNSHLGWAWNSPALTGAGTGAKSMNMELAHSKAFASCQVEKVFQNVCLRKPGDAADRAKVEEFTQNFANNNYQLKQVFIDTANYCKGQ
ncbi:MAG: hypothetical protein U1B30_04275 [Pseudomonadota bacterium]|nr:hypothetical protein [Pseudomonadota bacterium]